VTRIVALLVLLAVPARAHEGPPYPVIVDRAVGPYRLSVWADPDVGTGTFFVTLAPDAEARVSLQTWPSTRRLAPARYDGVRQRDRVYRIDVPFDREERWGVRVVVEGAGEVEFEVAVTPPGYGRWDLLVYFTPFLMLGGLWVAVAVKRRRLLTPPPLPSSPRPAAPAAGSSRRSSSAARS
jgi:hypothetical protein